MTIAVGSKFPSVEVDKASWPPTAFNLADHIANKKVILVGLPGAFTPTCSDVHMPGFYAAAKDFAELDVDKIAVVTANDRYVNTAWADSCEVMAEPEEAGAPVEFLADPRGEHAGGRLRPDERR